MTNGSGSSVIVSESAADRGSARSASCGPFHQPEIQRLHERIDVCDAEIERLREAAVIARTTEANLHEEITRLRGLLRDMLASETLPTSGICASARRWESEMKPKVSIDKVDNGYVLTSQRTFGVVTYVYEDIQDLLQAVLFELEGRSPNFGGDSFGLVMVQLEKPQGGGALR